MKTEKPNFFGKHSKKNRSKERKKSKIYNPTGHRNKKTLFGFEDLNTSVFCLLLTPFTVTVSIKMPNSTG